MAPGTRDRATSRNLGGIDSSFLSGKSGRSLCGHWPQCDRPAAVYCLLRDRSLSLVCRLSPPDYTYLIHTTQMWGCLQPLRWLWSEADSHEGQNSKSGSNVHTFVLGNHVLALPALISTHQRMQVFLNYRNRCILKHVLC